MNIFDWFCVAIFVLKMLGYMDFPMWIIIVYLVVRFISYGNYEYEKRIKKD